MPGEGFKCGNCISMSSVEEGEIPKEFIEYDFAEDALDFEVVATHNNETVAVCSHELQTEDAVVAGVTGTLAGNSIGFRADIFGNALFDWSAVSVVSELNFVAVMVCEDRCGCGAFCQRLFCRARPPECSDTEEAIPVTSIQLAEARDIKFTQNLREPLSIGSHIVCTGTPSDDLPWFAVNIGCGDAESGRGDVAVHFNVRLPQCYVVRNTRRHDKWGQEETTAYRLFPFKINQPFTIEILVDEKETLWAVDGEHYCSYAHRNPSALNAEWIQVTGVRDATLNIQKTDIYPTLAPTPIEIPLTSDLSAPIENEPSWKPNVIAKLSNGIPEGHQIIIIGRLRPLLHSFALDLMDAAREWPRANVLLHVNLRAHVDAQQARQLVVLNAWLGAWGAERRQRSARFVPGTETTIRIVRGDGEWSVFADGVLVGELEARAAAAGVRALRLRGDLFPRRLLLGPCAGAPAAN